MHLNPSTMAENVWEVLSNAAIDWEIDGRGSTYVTSLAFPFWLAHHAFALTCLEVRAAIMGTTI